jgi:NAD-dependent DNA ligase
MEIRRVANEITDQKFLTAIGCSGVGEIISENIIAKINLFDLIYNPDKLKNVSIDGVGDIIFKHIFNTLPKFKELYEYMTENYDNKLSRQSISHISKTLFPEFLESDDEDDTHQTPTPIQINKSQFSRKTVVLTGVSELYTRTQLRNILKSKLETKVASSVGTKVDFVITNDLHTGTSKLTQAKRLGIPIVLYQELHKDLI